MSTASAFLPTSTPLRSDSGLLAYARILSGVRVGAECLPPDVERQFVKLIRKMTSHLDYLCGKPAFCREAAEEYHRDRTKSRP